MDISSLLEVEVKEGKASDIPNNGEIAAYKNIPDFSIRDIASVRFRKLHCTACDIHIGSAPSEAHNMHEHPVLHVLLCTNCRNFYGDGTFEQGDDATDMFCRWCANGGNLYCCSYCSNTFCYNCIKRNFDPMVRKKIERDEKWKCFVCNPADLYTARAACWALLQHVQTVTRILQSDRKMTPQEIESKMNLDEAQCCPHRNKRKRAETVTDEEEEEEVDNDDVNDVEYSVARKKRRKLSNARRRRRIKLEAQDHPSEGSTATTISNNQRPGSRAERRDNEGTNFSENRRRRTETQSANEMPTLVPEELPLIQRTKNRRHRSDIVSMTNFSIHDDDIPAPLLQCDQSMIEGVESLSFGGPPLPEPREPSSSNLDHPRPLGISPIPTANLLKRPGPMTGPITRGGKSHRLFRSIGGTPVLVRKIAPSNVLTVPNAPATVQSLPMVTIPSRNHIQQTPSRVSVIQPIAKPTSSDSQNSTLGRSIRQIALTKSGMSKNAETSKNSIEAAPSIIDLDSDGDDPIVLVAPSRNVRNIESNDRVPKLSTVTFPVRPDDGLMTILSSTPTNGDKNDENEENDENDTSETGNKQSSVKTFDQTLRGPSKSIEAVLDSLKNKLKKVMDSAMLFDPDKELLAAKAKTRAVNRTIRRTVAELTSLNDNLVRAYHAYKRERTKEKVPHTELVTLEKRQKSAKLTPLDMECTRESEPEIEDFALDEDDSMDGENCQNIRPVREIRPFRRRVHRAVEARPQMKNKSVQAYDAPPRDCEKQISYALLLKADYDPKRERDILRPVMVPDKNFGKYEEEYISYLQHIEDHGIETEEAKELQPPQSISVKDLVQADISAISELRETRNATSTEREKTGLGKGPQLINVENIEILEEHVEIFTTKSLTSLTESSNSSEDSEIETSTTITLPGKKVLETSSSEEMEQQGLIAEKEVPEVTTSRAPNVAKKNETRSSDNNETSKRKKSFNQNTRKEASPSVDEETVLAVRALIDDDSSENVSNNTDILSSWKPVDSDDECTILE